MKSKFLKICCLMLAASMTLSLSSCGEKEKPIDEVITPSKPKDTTTVVTPPKPTVIDPVKINLTATACNDLTFTKLEAYSWQLDLSGGDPYVFSAKLPSALKPEHLIIEFEYKCAQDLSDLQIFYALKGAPAEASSETYAALKASPNDYVKFSANIAKFRNNGWGTTSDCLRIDPGRSGGFSFFIRNLVVRVMTDKEKEEYGEAQDNETAKAMMATNIGTYLGKTYPSTVKNVEVTADKVIIDGTCGSTGTYVLADVTPWQDITEMKTFPYTTEIKDKDFKITLDRFASIEEIKYDRVFSKWAIIKVDGDKQTLDSHGRYADVVAPKSSPSAVPLRNKKGYGAGEHGVYYQDCDDMDLGSITMNVQIHGFINGAGSDYNYGGQGYAVSAGYTSSRDAVLAGAKSDQRVVSAIILANTETIYKDPENTGGIYTMPNMTTAKAFNVYAAVLEYMASRYNGTGHGRISHWIMHNEVDMGSTWTNMGEQPMLRFLDRYIKSMRICYNIVRQYDQNASILGSYTHNWTNKDGGFSPKEMLERTVEYSEAEGDFQWGVAYHPYPQNLTKPKFWTDDTQATYSLNTKYITFKNLEVIDKWIKLPQNLYKGTKKRILFLSEQGTNSPSYSESDLKLQAAGAAWVWKKVQKLDGIDAAQWHNWADNPAEDGLRIGLRTFEEGSVANLTAKPAWYVWKAGGTQDENTVFDPYLNTLGYTNWDSIFNNNVN